METFIEDPDDPRVAVFLGLRDQEARKVREQPGGNLHSSFIAEGDLVIERGVRHGYPLRSVLISSRRTKDLPPSWDDAEVFRASDEVLIEVTGRPELRDPIAQFDRPPLPESHGLLRAHCSFAVLENINNPNNMGVIMRNAAALGVGAVLLDPTCSDPLYRRAIRASMGQVFAIPHARMGPLEESLAVLHGHDIVTIALSPTGETELSDIALEPTQKVAVLLGAEGPGLTDAALDGANIRAKITMSNDVDSLNVANAAAIAFYLLRH